MSEKEENTAKRAARIGRREMLGRVLALGAACVALPRVLIQKRRDRDVAPEREASNYRRLYERGRDLSG